MTPVPSLRPARFGDIDALLAINAEVQSLHHAQEPGRFLPQSDSQALAAFFAERLAKPEHRIALAELSDRPVGYAWSEIEERPASPFTFAQRRLHMHHLAVAAPWRRRGIAARLLSDAEAFGQAAGCDEAILNVLAGNEDALRFYARQAYAPMWLTMRRRLG